MDVPFVLGKALQISHKLVMLPRHSPWSFSLMKNSLLLVSAFFFLITSPALAQYTYVGLSGGSFFDETNWEDIGGVNPAIGSLPDSTTGAIAIDLIIDGSNVVALGQVDFGAGSLTLLNSADFSVTGGGNDLDFNSASSFSLTDSTVTVDGDVVIEGIADFSGGQVTSVTDDVEFQELLTLTIDGTSFSSGDNIFFDAFSGTIVNATFTSADRFGLRQSTALVIVDSTIDVQSGGGDLDDVFAAAGVGSSITLLGNSLLLADTVEEGVNLIIGGTSKAQLGGGGVEILDNGSTATLLTVDAMLQISAITDDPRAFIVDGRAGGVDYTADSSVWNVTNWDGASAVTLQLVVPEPASLVFALISICFFGGTRRQNLS